MARSEIVEGDPAAYVVQRIYKAGGLFDVFQGSRLGDFNDEAAREIGPVPQPRTQRLKPRSRASGLTGNIEPKPDFRTAGEFPNRLFEHVMVDEPDETQLLDGGNEFAAGDNASLNVAHSQQTLKIIYIACRRANHRLKSKKKAVLPQCRLHARAHRQAAALPVAPDFCLAQAHLSAALSSLDLFGPAKGLMMAPSAERPAGVSKLSIGIFGAADE